MKLKSKSIINLDVEIPVYDLEVPGNHNFMLSSGVIVHNSKDIADSLAGALTNASENTDIDEMYGAENFDSMFDINDDIYVSQNKYMKNYLDNIAKNNDNLVIDEELKADFTQEFDNQVDRLVSKSDKLDKEMESKIQKERMDKIKENESKRMSNNSFEKSFFNDDNDGFIIW